jgi:hypothetical protein
MEKLTWLDNIRRKAQEVTCSDVTWLCENPKHRPLRHPMCGLCHLAGKIEELREALKNNT